MCNVFFSANRLRPAPVGGAGRRIATDESWQRVQEMRYAFGVSSLKGRTSKAWGAGSTVTHVTGLVKNADTLSIMIALRLYVHLWRFNSVPVSEDVKAFSAFLLTDGEEPPISCDFLGSSSFPSQQLFLWEFCASEAFHVSLYTVSSSSMKSVSILFRR